MDPIERILGQSVTTMDASSLVSYIKTYLTERYDIELPVDGIIERKTIESFQKRYGKDKAGRIVQHVMLHHQGRKDGRYVTTSVFSTKMKWWCDLMYMELQAKQMRSSNTMAGTAEAESGFFDLKQLSAAQ